jgi:ribosomal protein L37E
MDKYVFVNQHSVVPFNMCIACGELTYKSGRGCSNCGYVGD